MLKQDLVQTQPHNSLAIPLVSYGCGIRTAKRRHNTEHLDLEIPDYRPTGKWRAGWPQSWGQNRSFIGLTLRSKEEEEEDVSNLTESK